MELELYEDHTIPKKNTLSIRLTESAVFLSTDVQHSRNRNAEPRSTLLRGLLILHLVKPTKITSIEVELIATSSISWPEGARRTELNEANRLFHVSSLYFRATKSNARRTASIGPGISYNNKTDDQDEDWNDWDEVTTASPGNLSRNSSQSNGNNETIQRNVLPRIRSSTSPSRSFFSQRMNRRVSTDSSQFQRMSLHEPDEGITDLHMQHLAPIPPYSATPDSSHFPTLNGNIDVGHPLTSPVPSLEEFRNSLHTYPSQSRTTSPAVSRCRSVIPEDDIVESELDTNSNTNPPTPRIITTIQGSPTHTPFTSTPSSPTYVSYPSPSPSTSQQSPQGRKRFSFSAVSNVIIDAVRSTPRGQSREREYERNKEQSVDTNSRGHRGRTIERGSDFVNLNSVGDHLSKNSGQKGRGVITLFMRDRDNDKDKSKAKAAEEGWKEFKKGTYTFPISFSIPGDAPPTMTCDHGAVSWQLKANVHRPGAFKSKMIAVRQVIIVACPTEEHTEDTGSINVERHWDQQLQYLISISGRSFYIGGTVPVTFTLMPLVKIKIHRLTAFVEERVDYLSNSKRIVRTDPIKCFSLLFVKGNGNDHTPILPLQSNDPDTLRHSPLFPLVDPDDDLSEVASNLMGPGPWTLHQDMKLPSSCFQMKFTNKNPKSNITVTHTLKFVMRVERGDSLFMDAKTGQRKLFDIVVQMPILILSCRCNPEWICLPRYSEVLDGSTAMEQSCPCHVSRFHSIHTSSPVDAISRHSSDSGASAAETSPVNTSFMPTLTQLRYNDVVRSSSLFERLVSGQESVSGEMPPAYDVGSHATNGVAALYRS